MGVKNVGTNWWPRAILAASILAVYLLTLPIQPTNDRDWDKDQLVLPLVNISGDGKIVIDNFRNFHYQTETKYDVNFQRKTFQLEDIHSVWYLIQRFTKYDGFAHTLVCFGLKNSIGEEDYFSISVEIRREEGELYSPIKGMYRQYELMYVVGDERDLVGVRTNVREDDRIFLYRINANPRQAQGLFLNYSDKINKLRRQPEFYHTLLNNCTNNIVKHTYPLTPQPLNPFDWQIVIPGYSAMVAYRQGLIGDGRESFTALQKRSRIDERARAAGITPSFSRDIRQGL